MAKETVKVDNGLEDVKLKSLDEMEPKKNKKDKKENKKQEKETKNKEKKQGYFSKVRAEMKLVSWPTKKQVFKYSMASIIMIVLLAGFFIGVTALFDLLYSLVQGWIG